MLAKVVAITGIPKKSVLQASSTPSVVSGTVPESTSITACKRFRIGSACVAIKARLMTQPRFGTGQAFLHTRSVHSGMRNLGRLNDGSDAEFGGNILDPDDLIDGLMLVIQACFLVV